LKRFQNIFCSSGSNLNVQEAKILSCSLKKLGLSILRIRQNPRARSQDRAKQAWNTAARSQIHGGEREEIGFQEFQAVDHMAFPEVLRLRESSQILTSILVREEVIKPTDLFLNIRRVAG
jgi:hypothetical protein